MNATRIAILLTLVAALFIARPARAAGGPPGASRRELAGHVFIPSALVLDPFATTHFGSTTGFGFASFTLREDAGQQEPPRETTYQLAAISQGFGLQIGILPSWALRLSAAGLVYSGVNAEGALAIGATVGYQVSGGTELSFRIGRRFRLGASADVEYSPTYDLNIGTAITQSLQAGRIDAGTLLVGTQTVAVLGGVQGALAVHRSLGLLFDLRYGHAFAEQSGQKANQGHFSAGAAFSFDLGAITPVPLGLVGAYRLGVPAVSQPSLSHDLSAGLFYTGRVNLALGPDVAFQLYPQRADLRVFSVIGQLALRYYW